MPSKQEHERQQHKEGLEWLKRHIQALPRSEALAPLAWMEQRYLAKGDLDCLRVVREVRKLHLPSTPPPASA
jgi:hypothetical protein